MSCWRSSAWAIDVTSSCPAHAVDEHVDVEIAQLLVTRI